MECSNSTTNPLFELLKKYVGDKMIEEMEENRRIQQKEMEIEESRREGGVWLFYIILMSIILIIFISLAYLIHYIQKYKQSGKAGPITRITRCRWKEEELIPYIENSYYEQATSNARILMIFKNNDVPNEGFEKIDKILKIGCNLENVVQNLVPRNGRLISIKMDGFEHGEKCHEFKPSDGETPGSYYTYQMFGNNKIQVTRYIVGGKSFVAGFCIYITSYLEYNSVDYNVDVVRNLMKSEKYPGKCGLELDEESSEKKVPIGFSIKYCQLLQRKLITVEESGVLRHQEWDKYEKKMKTEECQVCTEKSLNPPNYSSLYID